MDKNLVRGLDYYSRTTFEILTTALGAQSAVAGGGRYDALVKELDGPEIPAIGFAIGLDRLADIVEQVKGYSAKKALTLFIIALGDMAMELGYLWQSDLNLSGIRAEMDYSGRSLKSLMKRANKLNAGHVLIAGEKELEEKNLVLRNMETKKQYTVSMDSPVEEIRRLLIPS